MEQKKENAIVKPVDLLKQYLNAPSVQEQFKNALKENKDTFVASLIDLYNGDKSLQTCKPAALISEALRAATMKLPLNKALGFAYILVFNNSVKNDKGGYDKVPTPTFVTGYKGLIQLAMRTGQYKVINADAVYEGEYKSYNRLTGELDISGEKKSDKVIGYFAYFEMLNGFRKVAYKSIEDMAKYALRYSPSFKGRTAPKYTDLIKAAQKQVDDGVAGQGVGWMADFNSMACKTVLRNLLSKYGYLSIEMQNVYTQEVTAEATALQIRDEDNSEEKPVFNAAVDTNENIEEAVIEGDKDDDKENVTQDTPQQVDSLFS